jgi:hypothetical protein
VLRNSFPAIERITNIDPRVLSDPPRAFPLSRWDRHRTRGDVGDNAAGKTITTRSNTEPIPLTNTDVAFYNASKDLLTPLHRGPRDAIRFDVSWRFGPFSAAILDHNPVDLNCLLYRMEMDAAVCMLDQPRSRPVV